MKFNWWNSAPEFSAIEDKNPLLSFIDEKTIITKDGFFVSVVELQGKDYAGLDKPIVESLFIIRKRFIESIPSSIMPTIFSPRYKLNKQFLQNRYVNNISQRVGDKWASNFISTYKTRHFIVLRTAIPSLLDQFVVKAQNQGETTSEHESYRTLHDVIENLTLQLEDYKPHILNQKEQCSFWASYFNGREIKQTSSDDLDDVLTGANLFWPEKKAYQVYEDGDKDRYSAWLAIKFYKSDFTTIKLFEELFKIKQTFTVYQNFQNVDKDKAMTFIESKEKNVLSFAKSKDTRMTELNEIKSRIESNDLTLASYSFSLQVFSDSLNDLEIAVRDIKNVIESFDFRMARERLNQEPLFWSNLPSLEYLNARKRTISSENIADFLSFSSVGEGIEATTWGETPVTRFKTLIGSEFSFTFHPSSEILDLGHTMVFGGSNAGKTTLISFLISECLKYPKFRALSFDRLHGMEVFTKFLGGEYIDFLSTTNINPLQLKNTPSNITFLSTFFEMLSGQNSDEIKGQIKQALDMAYTLTNEERTLDNLELAFGLKEKGSFRQAMDKWLSNGAYGNFFTGKTDSLSFSKPLVTFDMTTLLDVPEVLAPMTYYLFHKLKNIIIEDPSPYIVFVDEVPKYIENEQFGKELLMLTREIRKTNGVFITAAQEPKAILNNKIGKLMIDSVANFILYSNPTAEEKDYCEGLGLTKEEFTWIKQSNKRQVMLKRKGAESIILDVDLNPLNNLLSVFDSGTISVNKVRKEIKNGGNWRSRYLDPQYKEAKK